jgi:hypothetical protein
VSRITIYRIDRERMDRIDTTSWYHSQAIGVTASPRSLLLPLVSPMTHVPLSRRLSTHQSHITIPGRTLPSQSVCYPIYWVSTIPGLSSPQILPGIYPTKTHHTISHRLPDLTSPYLTVPTLPYPPHLTKPNHQLPGQLVRYPRPRCATCEVLHNRR